MKSADSREDLVKMNLHQREELAKRIGVKLNREGFIEIPSEVKRLKLDVGLSMSAPHAFEWLTNDPELFVIGFEPIIENVEILVEKISKMSFNLKMMDRFLIIPCALGKEHEIGQLYMTTDRGLASFLKPKTFPVEEARPVCIESLDDFMELIPIGRFGRVDYLKTDCQGFDYEVILGAKETITDIAIITCEMDTKSYFGAKDNIKKIERLLTAQGFIYMNPLSRKSKAFSKVFGFTVRFSSKYQNRLKRIHETPKYNSPRVTVIDPTFLNYKYKELVGLGEITANQFN
jgi:FkbM family methyltransferase